MNWARRRTRHPIGGGLLRLVAGRDDAGATGAVQALCEAPPVIFVSLQTNLVLGRNGELGIEVAAKVCRDAMTRLRYRRFDVCYDYLDSLVEARLGDFANRQWAE